MSYLARFRDRYWPKIVNFNPPHLHMAPPIGVNPLEFCRDLWRHKSSVHGLSYGMGCV